MKRKGSWAAAIAAVWTFGTAVAFAADPDSGNFTVRITPSVDFGLTVDTSGSKWASSTNLDVTLNLATDELLAVPVKVTMNGNFNDQEIQLSAADPDTWKLDADEVDTLDRVRLYALFGRDAYAGSPAVGDFAGTTNLVLNGAGQAGQPQANELADTNHKYETLTSHPEYADVDTLVVGNVRRLWLRARTPSFSTVATQQTFTVTVTAVTGAGS